MALAPSSPRLPSPPPPTEIQIGPKSPSFGDASETQESMVEQYILDTNASRRIHPGTKAADMAAGPPLIPLMELDSAFQLQEHLKALHYHHTRPSSDSHTIPINRHTAALIATPPPGVDRALWLYELCRFLINRCNDLIVGFLFDTPPCSAATCPEMRASEWQFLCAVHESPKSCCAIDYCCHTLDWATNIVTSQKIFPSRLSLGAGDSMDDKGAGVKHLVNIFRRLHRIFAHAWFQHRGVFWQVEGQTGLYVLFKTVCDSYELLPAENYKLPPEAEGLEPTPEQKPAHTILKPDSSNIGLNSGQEEDPKFVDPNSFGAASRNNTRRHIRSSPSTGAAVTTVLEADEDESDMANRLRELSIKEQEQEALAAAEEPTPEELPVPEEIVVLEEESEVTILVSQDEDEDEDEDEEAETAEKAVIEDDVPAEKVSADADEGEDLSLTTQTTAVKDDEDTPVEDPKIAETAKEQPVHVLHLDEEVAPAAEVATPEGALKQ